MPAVANTPKVGKKPLIRRGAVKPGSKSPRKLEKTSKPGFNPFSKEHQPVKKAPAKSKPSKGIPAPAIDGDTDIALALKEMVKGGESRFDVVGRVAEALHGQKTRNGRPKTAQTIVNHAMKRALAHGYTIVATWKLVPPAEAVQASPTLREILFENEGFNAAVDKYADKTAQSVEDAKPKTKKLPMKPRTIRRSPEATKKRLASRS